MVLFGVFVAGCEAGSSGPPRVAARIAGTQIDPGEVSRLVEQARAANEKVASGDPRDTERLAVRFLARLALLEKLAKDLGIDRGGPTEAPSGSAVPQEALEGQGLTELDLARSARASRLSAALARVLFPDAAVSDAELKAYYDGHAKDFGTSWRADAAVAFFQERADAEELRRRVGRGERYTEVLNTLQPSEIGELGQVTSSSKLPSEILSAVAVTPKGTVSGPIDTGRGSEFAAVWVKSREDLGARSFEQARPDLVKYLTHRRQLELFNDWFDEQLGGTRIDVDPYYGRWDRRLGMVVE
jgi:hypothetical protein